MPLLFTVHIFLSHNHNFAHFIMLSLFQTWDVIESPMFAAVFAEAADTALRSIVNHLKCKVFTEESDVDDYGPPRARTPPLARLLPQLKFAALRLLPSDPTAPISSDVLEMISNPVLDTLCVSLFDLGMEQTNSSNQAMSQSTRNGSSSGDGSGKTVERPDGNSGTNWPH